MEKSPLISVIMPVYNGEKYLAEAVNSVLSQTWRPLEVICINDGSLDGSLAILESFGSAIITLDSKENRGIAEGRNMGLRIAKGEYIALMDADDIWMPKKLSLQMAQFQKNQNLDISFSWSKNFLSPELPEDIKQLRYVSPDPLAGYFSATALIKKSAFDTVGAFNPKWRVGEFVDWFSRAKALGLTYDIIPEIAHWRRIHQTNTGVVQRTARVDYLRIIKESLDRKRQSNQ